MKTFYLSFSALLLAILIWGCSSDSDPITPNEPTPYENASTSKGGIMFDKFWSTEAGFNQNDPNIALFNSKSDFFRCKQCHGWDNLGQGGSYIGRGPNANRPNVANLNLYARFQLMTPQQLFDAMKLTAGRRDISFDFGNYVPGDPSNDGHKMPNYAQLLTDAQIWDLVKYMKEGAFDVSQLYDATYNGVYPSGSASYSNVGRDGNATDGATFYSNNCSSCHGVDGTQFLIENMTVGKFTRSKPNEVHHKVKYGQLGSGMVGEFDMNLSGMKNLYKALADPVAFPD